MRVLLDHCVPASFRQFLVGHEVRTVAELARHEAGDASLLRACAGRFDVLITLDRSFAAGEILPRSVARVVLRAVSSGTRDLVPLVPALLSVLASPRRGAVTELGSPSR